MRKVFLIFGDNPFLLRFDTMNSKIAFRLHLNPVVSGPNQTVFYTAK